MTLACKAVARGTSIRRAAEEYNVPRSTLQNRVSGRVPDGKLSGPPRYLTSGEEYELVEFICMCSKLGCAKSRLEIFAFVQQLLKMKGIVGKVTNGYGWWEGFRRRHQNFTLKSPEPLAHVRMLRSVETPESTSLAVQTGLKFIPMFTPMTFRNVTPTLYQRQYEEDIHYSHVRKKQGVFVCVCVCVCVCT